MKDNPIQAWFQDIAERAKIAAAPRNLVFVAIFQALVLTAWFAAAYALAPDLTSTMWPYSLGIHIAVTVVFQLMTAKPARYRRKDAV